MKKIKSIIGLAVMLALAGGAFAADTFRIQGVPGTSWTAVDSAAGTYNGSAAWATGLASGAYTTNFTFIPLGTAREVSLQFTCASTNTTTTSNVVWTIYKSVEAIAPTNAAGTSLRYDLLGYVTNVMNGATLNTTVASYSPALLTATANQGLNTGISGSGALYVGWVNIPALSGLTNFSIRVNTK